MISTATVEFRKAATLLGHRFTSNRVWVGYDGSTESDICFNLFGSEYYKSKLDVSVLVDGRVAVILTVNNVMVNVGMLDSVNDILPWFVKATKVYKVGVC